MRIIRHAAVAVALASTATPAMADKFFAVTPSGSTETLFPEKAQTVIGKLSSRCIDVKWTVVSSSSSELVCEAPLNMGQSILGQMLMGNSYSTPPRRYFRFNVAEINGVSRVQASGWMELQMAFGQTKRTGFSGPEFHNGMMNFMTGAGGKPPVGTTFPNHAFLGIDLETIAEGKHQQIRIAKVHTGSPAEKAGLRAGDVIAKVAGERLKTENDWLDAAARAAAKPTYEVEFVRDGKQMKLTLERAFRPAWTEQVVAAVEPSAPQPASTSMSVADELTKLAKLKADGLLTETEFEAQKKKLLGQ